MPMIKKIQSNPLNFLSFLIVGYTIFPFLVLCFYNVPLGDDFWYAESFRTNGFWQTQLKYYHEWSGRYSASAFISALNPLSYGYFNLSFIHPFLLIIGFAFALYKVIQNSIDFFKLPLNAYFVFSCLFFFYFNYVPDFGETFYWMAGAYTYQLPILFFLVYLSSVLHLFKADTYFSIIKCQFFSLLSLIIILGCNEVIVVYANFVNLLLVLTLLKNKKYLYRFLPFFIISIMISYFMITAPGNFERGSLFVKSEFHFFNSTLHSLSRTLFVMFYWGASLFLVLLFLPTISSFKIDAISNLLKLLKSRSKIIIASFLFLTGVLFIGFFPSIYTTNWIPQRAYTPIFFIFILFSTLLILTLIQKSKLLSNINLVLSNTKVLLILMPILVVTLSNNSNIMNAYVDLTAGKAKSYKKQVIETYKILEKNREADTIYVDPIKKKPLILPYRWPGENRLVNSEWEAYFKINRIELSTHKTQ